MLFCFFDYIYLIFYKETQYSSNEKIKSMKSLLWYQNMPSTDLGKEYVDGFS
jgi:hypothetical protein